MTISFFLLLIHIGAITGELHTSRHNKWWSNFGVSEILFVTLRIESKSVYLSELHQKVSHKRDQDKDKIAAVINLTHGCWD